MRFPPGEGKNNPSILGKTRQIPKVGATEQLWTRKQRTAEKLYCSLFAVSFAALQINTET